MTNYQRNRTPAGELLLIIESTVAGSCYRINPPPLANAAAGERNNTIWWHHITAKPI